MVWLSNPCRPKPVFLSRGISVTDASVVSMRAEIEAAFCSAVRVSFGRIDDASLQQVLVFAGSYVEPFIPAAFLDFLDDQRSKRLPGQRCWRAAVSENASVPDGCDATFLRLLFRRVGNDDISLLDFSFFEWLNQHAIAERFHIDCHMFCITPGSGPERCIQCCA